MFLSGCRLTALDRTPSIFTHTRDATAKKIVFNVCHVAEVHNIDEGGVKPCEIWI
jgi:hypothetical protein